MRVILRVRPYERIKGSANQLYHAWVARCKADIRRSGLRMAMQPFACLPNHVTGKAMIKPLRERYPDSNIIAVDYDNPGASEVNQINRIKLMLSVAVKDLRKTLELTKEKLY